MEMQISTTTLNPWVTRMERKWPKHGITALHLLEREDAIFNTTNDHAFWAYVHADLAINKAITNIMEDIMSSWDDQFMSESFAAQDDPYGVSPQGAIKICEARWLRIYHRIGQIIPMIVMQKGVVLKIKTTFADIVDRAFRIMF